MERHCQEHDYSPHLQQFTLLLDPSSPCCWRPRMEGHCQEQNYTPHLQQFILLLDLSSPCCWRPGGVTLQGEGLLSSSATVYSTL